MTISVETANNYFSGRLGAESWFELDNNQKEAAITTAENNIKKLPFIGKKVTQNQVDIFPRCYKGRVIQLPDDVMKAIFEEAYSLVCQNNINVAEIPDGVQSMSLGGASISFKDGKTAPIDCLSKNSKKFLDGWIQKGFDIEPEKFDEVY